jgi:hypothetical protein
MSTTSIERVLERVKPVLDELQKENVSTKVGVDRDANMIRIYGEGSDNIKRASSALSEILELAYATAEHHPYWAILYHTTEISKAVLHEWESDLNSDRIGEMSWRCDEIKMALGRLATK